MDEIRFNQETNTKAIERVETPKFKIALMDKRTKIAIIAILILVFFGAVIFSIYRSIPVSDPNASDYYAIFLSNGQIYFGQIDKNDGKDMVVSNVYHLQSNGETYQSLNQNQNMPAGATVSLIKLSDELHGPTNKMFINRSQILFYEQLRKDSKVVELIAGLKN